MAFLSFEIDLQGISGGGILDDCPSVVIGGSLPSEPIGGVHRNDNKVPASDIAVVAWQGHDESASV